MRLKNGTRDCPKVSRHPWSLAVSVSRPGSSNSLCSCGSSSRIPEWSFSTKLFPGWIQLQRLRSKKRETTCSKDGRVLSLPNAGVAYSLWMTCLFFKMVDSLNMGDVSTWRLTRKANSRTCCKPAWRRCSHEPNGIQTRGLPNSDLQRTPCVLPALDV